MKIFLLTPPFTQLNTPYPATAYLKAFLNQQSIQNFQSDLGLEVLLKIFSSNGLKEIFNVKNEIVMSENAKRIFSLQNNYIETIDIVVEFLQSKHLSFASQICTRNFLPEASRFSQLQDLQWAYGNMGIQDKAKHLATLYLEDIADYIKECVDEHFGFSRYAERLGQSANTFDELYDELSNKNKYVDNITTTILHTHLSSYNPNVVCMSVPFPGNLYSAFKCAQYIKIHFSHIKIVMGGGFPNTELRSLSDKRVFEFFDYIILDDGEMPLLHLIEYFKNTREIEMLKRTFALINNKVRYINGTIQNDFKQIDLPTPDYSDLLLNQYISAVEIINPMHKLWSDSVWNKLTMAHGCYWGKCTFCDISLDYIKRYEPITANLLCNHIENLLKQNGNRNFHFVDEAAPPALMKALALEILKRKLIINWWTNIRFEKSFTFDVCFLLKQSGCIAVSGGLEVASDRLLKLIDKGVSVESVTQTTHNFSRCGILVHAYLMYGFPTETEQETIDSLEVVRQMFAHNIVQSGFWHQFAMTAHSPIGLQPAKYKTNIIDESIGTFANNDIAFEDKIGDDATKYSQGLKLSLYNYMQQAGFDLPLQHWFNKKVCNTKLPKLFIENLLVQNEAPILQWRAKVYWLFTLPEYKISVKSKKGSSWELVDFVFELPSKKIQFSLKKNEGIWFYNLLTKLNISNEINLTLNQIKVDYESNDFDEDFELFWFNKILKQLNGNGLIAV